MFSPPMRIVILVLIGAALPAALTIFGEIAEIRAEVSALRAEMCEAVKAQGGECAVLP